MTWAVPSACSIHGLSCHRHKGRLAAGMTQPTRQHDGAFCGSYLLGSGVVDLAATGTSEPRCVTLALGDGNGSWRHVNYARSLPRGYPQRRRRVLSMRGDPG